MTSLLTGLALCCPLAHAHGLRQFSFSFSPIPPSFLSLSLSLSLVDSRSQPRNTRPRRCGCALARAYARCTRCSDGGSDDAHTDALSRIHARAHIHAAAHWAQTAITAGVQRSLDSSLSRLPPPPEPSRFLPPPLLHLRCSLALARSPHDFLSLANFSCLFRIARSLLLTPSAFLFLHAGYISPFPLYTTSRFLHHQVPPFLSVHRFPCFSLLYALVDSVSSCHSSFPSGLLPSRPSFPLDGHDSSTLVARRTVHCVATLVPSLLLSPSFTRTQRALGAVERERESAMSERREPETPFLAAATRNGISRTDNGPFRGLLLALAGCCCPFVPSSS